MSERTLEKSNIPMSPPKVINMTSIKIIESAWGTCNRFCKNLMSGVKIKRKRIAIASGINTCEVK